MLQHNIFKCVLIRISYKASGLPYMWLWYWLALSCINFSFSNIRIQSLNKEKDSQLYKRNPSLFNELLEMDKKLSQEFFEDRKFYAIMELLISYINDHKWTQRFQLFIKISMLTLSEQVGTLVQRKVLVQPATAFYFHPWDCYCGILNQHDWMEALTLHSN